VYFNISWYEAIMVVPYFSTGCIFALCVSVRLCLAGGLAATHWLPAWAGALGGLVAAVLTFNFAVATYRMKPAGPLNYCAWWGSLRKVHTAVWAVVAALLFARVPYGGTAAFADPLLGVVAYWKVRPAFFRALANENKSSCVRNAALLDNDDE
jgi:hypothetical protein